jgi:hypothetical protein
LATHINVISHDDIKFTSSRLFSPWSIYSQSFFSIQSDILSSHPWLIFDQDRPICPHSTADCLSRKLSSPNFTTHDMTDPMSQPVDPLASLPQEAVDFAGRMYDAARIGDLSIFQQALPAGLPPNLTNEKGDTLVRRPDDKPKIHLLIFFIFFS